MPSWSERQILKFACILLEEILDWDDEEMQQQALPGTMRADAQGIVEAYKALPKEATSELPTA
jgi:hypothetical protein